MDDQRTIFKRDVRDEPVGILSVGDGGASLTSTGGDQQELGLPVFLGKLICRRRGEIDGDTAILALDRSDVLGVFDDDGGVGVVVLDQGELVFDRSVYIDNSKREKE